MSAPARHKNLAVTVDGARYNKNKRPDNFSALRAMPPPPRPSSSPSSQSDLTPAPGNASQQSISPSSARKDRWGKWSQSISEELEDGGPTNREKLDAATQHTEELMYDEGSVQPAKAISNESAIPDARAEDAAAGTSAKDATDGDDIKIEAANVVVNNEGDEHKGASEGLIKRSEDDDSWETSDYEPGSPIDEPTTHFSTFTPMRQKETIYKRKPDEDFDDMKSKKKTKHQPRRNPLYGQTAAFPDFSEENSEGGGYDLEALRYLKQVMNEANGLPLTFSGPTASASNLDDPDDMLGYYEDGVYVACPPPMIGPIMPPDYPAAAASETTAEDEQFEDDEVREDEIVDPQQEYHNRLLLRFEGFRKLLAQNPSNARKASLQKTYWFTFPTLRKSMPNAVRRWLRNFAEEHPHPVQVAQMDSFCVLQLLDILKRKLECFKNIEENTSIWIFALLARLAEVIPIYCDAASIVRELALRALMVRVTFTGEHIAELEDKVPHYYAEDQDFFEHVGLNPKPNKKQRAKQEAANGDVASVSDGVETEGDADIAELREALDQQKELILRKEALQKRVDEMPCYTSKRVAFGLEPRDASDTESDGEDELKRQSPLERKSAEGEESVQMEEPAQEQEDSNLPNPDANTRTTLDMILTVACDVFGQKDLSKYKEVWGEIDYLRPSVEEKEELKRLDEEATCPSLPPILSPIGSPIR